ncbi:MAG: SDR family oxidoreductase [Candidatus Lambdaproteobacteria bacterium]|nr:SDR family oxidoreductase [Candidatus Lambdaproteobacteria bacterium]
MGDRLKGKVAIVTGAGQTAGETTGNGRATAILYAREGARIFAVDLRLESARETCAMIGKEGGTCTAFAADVSVKSQVRAMTEACLAAYGRIDVLHNNVGTPTGDRNVLKLAEEDWQRIMDVNLKSMYLTIQSVLPHMVAQGSGSIINISSTASIMSHPLLAYKVSKAGVNALTHAVAMGAAPKGVRVNAILPGLMNTPMAITEQSRNTGKTPAQVIADRDAMVPLRGKMGDAWDVAYLSLFLASEEARFITSTLIPVDGGQSGKIG